jgi:tRNA modification GTPase
VRAAPGDTIAAIATALGPGGIAVVRITGAGAVGTADRIFKGTRRLADVPSHSVHHGHIVDSTGREVDDILATVMLAPKTYTTEDVVEFGCHGGAMPAKRVLEVCLEAGARIARRGEFTERALLGGRIDLVQAEAVADIVAAKTRRGLELALGQLEGALSHRLRQLREELLAFRAEIESLIDFSDDDIEGSTVSAIIELGRTCSRSVDLLLSDCAVGAVVRDGVSVAIVGRPNVGKSSLLNAFLRRERAIVTALPGTTRDAIEETVDVDGVPVCLIDTAGWRSTADPAEAEGVARAKAAAAGADLVLLVLDITSGVTEEDRAIAGELDHRRTVVVLNKCDLVPRVSLNRGLETTLVFGSAGSGEATDVSGSQRKSGVESVAVSALTAEGIGELQRAISMAILEGAGTSAAPVVTNVRHVDALKRVALGVGRGIALLEEDQPPELAAMEVSEATAALGEITGETTPEDVLRHIFERFCVGK